MANVWRLSGNINHTGGNLWLLLQSDIYLMQWCSIKHSDRKSFSGLNEACPSFLARFSAFFGCLTLYLCFCPFFLHPIFVVGPTGGGASLFE